YVKSSADNVVEAAGGGYDTVYAYTNVTLTANVEQLRMATGGLTGTGNDLDNRMIGSKGDDTMFGMDGDDNFQGLGGNDSLHGGNGNDSIAGQDGNDKLYGDNGNDYLNGGNGNDVLDGGAGDDLIEGGAGQDTMTGGAGADTFRFRSGDASAKAPDIITDFTSGEDMIELVLIDAKSATKYADHFTFIGNQNFHKVAGELHYTVVNGNAIVEGDTNGDGIADFAIQVNNVTSLKASDFTL
ncbi:MAG: calcium-binding protein, partial [Sphingobium sp.]